jgi:hypothetical protein
VFKEPHPSLDVHKTRLGAWDPDKYENLSLFMPGVYWHDEARKKVRRGEAPELKSRGVRGHDLGKVIEQVDRQWTRLSPDSGWPKSYIPVAFAMTTAKQAVVRGAWETCGQMVYGAERKLDANPVGKRRDDRLFWDEEVGGYRTERWVLPIQQVETVPYVRGFGEMDEDDLGEMVTPDGPVGALQAWQLRG